LIRKNNSLFNNLNLNKMKTTIKFFAAIAIMSGIAVNGMAQTNSNTITATAKVIDQISVLNFQDLNFGQVTVGQNKTIDIDGTVTGGAAVSDVSTTVGKFKVYAGIGSDVQLTFSALPSELDEDGVGTATLPIVYDKDNDGTTSKNFAAYGLAADATDPTRFAAATGVRVATGSFPTNTLDTKNGIYVFIGGTVKPDPTQARGTYSGNITLTATYN
jgi:spore coat protein U-like protein